jgi:hypothetical protein
MSPAVFVLLAAFAILVLAALLVPVRLQLILSDRRRSITIGWLALRAGRDLKDRAFVLHLRDRTIVRKQSRKTRREKAKERPQEQQKKKRGFKLADLWEERDLAQTSIQAGLRFLWEVLKSIRWDKLLLELDVSTPDPALTGLLYGELCAVKYLTEHAFPQVQIDVRADFTREVPGAEAESIISIKPLNVLVPLSKLFLALPKIRIIKLLLRKKRR